MRYFIGIVTTSIVLITVLYFALQLFNITLFDIVYLKNAWIIFLISFSVLLLLLFILPFFFKPHQLGYEGKKGNVAQPKK